MKAENQAIAFDLSVDPQPDTHVDDF